MKKLLVGIFVPATQEHFDVFAPSGLPIGTLTSLLADGAAEICQGRYVSSGREMLVRRDPDTLLDPSRTLGEYDIRDGTQLVLI